MNDDGSCEIEQVALRLLARREHSRFELYKKLAARFSDPVRVDSALNRLQEQGYLDDHRFAKQYLEYRKQKGFGPFRIAKELQERGLDQTIIEEFLDIEDPEWEALISLVIARKYRDFDALDLKERGKCARFLEYRGFSTSLIARIVFK